MITVGGSIGAIRSAIIFATRTMRRTIRITPTAASKAILTSVVEISLR
jgi:hypothetical protein